MEGIKKVYYCDNCKAIYPNDCCCDEDEQQEPDYYSCNCCNRSQANNKGYCEHCGLYNTLQEEYF